MQDRRVEIVNMDTVGRNAIANLIGFSMDNALFHAAVCNADRDDRYRSPPAQIRT